MKSPGIQLPDDSTSTTLPLESGNEDQVNLLDSNNQNSNILASKLPVEMRHIVSIAGKFIRYIGPGLMVSVAYMDPGNFSASIASARFQYKLLFSLMISNIMAGFLQIQACRLGICTGQDLATNCREHLPKYVNYIVYVFAEISVIATDVAEIIGTAIAFNILFNIPLLGGILLTIIDVIFVVMAYRPDGPPLLLRLFEGFVSALVLATVICFGIELGNVSKDTNWVSVLEGFFPSKEVFSSTEGLYLSAALLGSNLMPHSIYLGSGVVQSRMKDYDVKHGFYEPPKRKLSPRNIFCFPTKKKITTHTNGPNAAENVQEETDYRPSMDAINNTMYYTVAELIVSLITVALFVNAAILIVAGTALSKPMDDDGDGDLENADLFTLHYLLSSNLSKTAGTIFALALLFSGLCGGTVVTVAGQMIMEGHVKVSMPPGLKRILTRIVSITPCIIVVLKDGREGLSNVLNGSQVVLSMLLPFVSAPLIWLTCNPKIMRVRVGLARDAHSRNDPSAIQLQNMDSDGASIESSSDSEPTELEAGEDTEDGVVYKNMANGKVTSIISVVIWAVISLLNFWLLANVAMGNDVPI